MSQIPLARCQFLIPFISIHDEIGAPTVSLLEKLRLPTSLEEKADAFMPVLRAVEFAERAQRSQGIIDIGFQAAKRLQYCHLSAQLRQIIGCSPTLFTALQQSCKWATLEDNVLSVWLERTDDHLKICSKLIGTAGISHLEHSQWLQNIFLIHIVRQFAGSEWAPTTIAFEARYVPSLETQACWPNTRFLSGQQASWIEVPLALMGVPSPVVDTPFDFPEGNLEANGGEIISSLKLMLPAYLDERIPTVAEIAEMARTSVRSLQRKLSFAGLTYSDLLEAARYEKAAKLLRSTDIKVIEVAFASGYADPAHFTRAFRRMSGTTPRRFRNEARAR